ncbi:hypothetical protein [Pseudaeromonas paramecii]|uniref:Uncharacterized protein n=1 Tax=Pseudaeromonas paramecii TaxID=2138166 RepID=A0ABP8PXC1_9GAMM
MMADAEKIIESIMKEPMALEPTDYEERIRRNLLVISTLSNMAWAFGAQPSGHLEIWGLSFEHLDINAILFTALLITLYQLTHYVWVLSNKLMYWRVRLTGVTLPARRGSVARATSSELSDLADFGGDEKNSNLYVWMIERAPAYHNFINTLNVSRDFISTLNEILERSKPTAESAVLEKLNTIEKSTERLISEINCIRINRSLHRFDRWFDFMIKSQSARWFVLDLFLPLVLGVVAIIGLLCMIFGGYGLSGSQVFFDLFNHSLI